MNVFAVGRLTPGNEALSDGWTLTWHERRPVLLLGCSHPTPATIAGMRELRISCSWYAARPWLLWLLIHCGETAGSEAVWHADAQFALPDPPSEASAFELVVADIDTRKIHVARTLPLAAAAAAWHASIVAVAAQRTQVPDADRVAAEIAWLQRHVTVQDLERLARVRKQCVQWG